MTFECIFRFFNEYIDSSYVCICLLALIPLYVAIGIFCAYSGSRYRSGRRWLWIACILAILSVLIYFICTIVYFSSEYPEDKVYIGKDDKNNKANYSSQSKKSFIIIQVLIFVTLLIFLVYSTVASYRWAQLADLE